MKSPDELARSLNEHAKNAKDGGKVHKVMAEGKRGELHSGSKHGPIVEHGSKQEIAIALSEARKAGEDIKSPPK